MIRPDWCGKRRKRSMANRGSDGRSSLQMTCPVRNTASKPLLVGGGQAGGGEGLQGVLRDVVRGHRAQLDAGRLPDVRGHRLRAGQMRQLAADQPEGLAEVGGGAGHARDRQESGGLAQPRLAVPSRSPRPCHFQYKGATHSPDDSCRARSARWNPPSGRGFLPPAPGSAGVSLHSARVAEPDAGDHHDRRSASHDLARPVSRRAVIAPPLPERAPLRLRALRIFRQEGARGVGIRLLGATVYRRLVVMHRSLDDPRAAIAADLPVTVELLGERDVDDYVQLCPWASAAEIRGTPAARPPVLRGPP